MLRKPHIYAERKTEEICRFASENNKEKNLPSIDREVMVVINCLDNFRLFIINKHEILVRIP